MADVKQEQFFREQRTQAQGEAIQRAKESDLDKCEQDYGKRPQASLSRNITDLSGFRGLVLDPLSRQRDGYRKELATLEDDRKLCVSFAESKAKSESKSLTVSAKEI